MLFRSRSWATVTVRGAHRVEQFPLPTRRLRKSWAREIRTRYSSRSINRGARGQRGYPTHFPFSLLLLHRSRATAARLKPRSAPLPFSEHAKITTPPHRTSGTFRSPGLAQAPVSSTVSPPLPSVRSRSCAALAITASFELVVELLVVEWRHRGLHLSTLCSGRRL